MCVYVSLWDTPSKQTALYTFQHTLAVHIKDKARIVTQASSDFRSAGEKSFVIQSAPCHVIPNIIVILKTVRVFLLSEPGHAESNPYFKE